MHEAVLEDAEIKISCFSKLSSEQYSFDVILQMLTRYLNVVEMSRCISKVYT